jgi:hypothetical protein
MVGKCLVKLQKALNLWVEDMSRNVEWLMAVCWALILYEEFSKGALKWRHQTISCK